MFRLQKLHIAVDEKNIIHWVDIDFPDSSTTVLLGHNGSGKTSLALTLAWHPKYRIQGHIWLDNDDITRLNTPERASKGIFLSFQNIPEIPGIKLIEYLRTIYNAHFRRNHGEKKPPSLFVFRRMVEKLLPEIGLSYDFLERDLFVWFSGWEKRRVELLQIALLDPRVIILDEVDSGLDIDALNILRHKIDIWRTSGKTIVIISHNLSFLAKITVDQVIILDQGKVVRSGDGTLLGEVESTGFKWKIHE